MVSVVLSRSRVAGDMKVDRIGICRNRVISHILEREPHKLPISIRQDESITSRHGEIVHASKHGGRTSTRHHATSSATSALCPRHPLIPCVHRDLLYQPPVRPRQNHRNRHPSPHLRYLPKCRAVGLVRYRIHTGIYRDDLPTWQSVRHVRQQVGVYRMFVELCACECVVRHCDEHGCYDCGEGVGWRWGCGYVPRDTESLDGIEHAQRAQLVCRCHGICLRERVHYGADCWRPFGG
jgi:hypothetical protein